MLYKSLGVISNYPQYYHQWDTDAASLLAHDPTFIMPMVVMSLNYALLIVSHTRK